jgi:hypothetical protein
MNSQREQLWLTLPQPDDDDDHTWHKKTASEQGGSRFLGVG